MQPHIRALRAYSEPSLATRTPRSVEYEAFSRATRHLISAASKGSSGFSDLAEAVHRNRRLWSLLATDVAGKGNALPVDLRARLFYLSEFTRIHSGKILREGAAVDPLIEINAIVMRGLHREGPVQ